MGYIGNQPFLGTVTGDVVVDGTVGTADLTDGAVTAAKLATTAIVDKLGYTPLSTSGTGATGTWDISISGNAATATTATNVSGGTASVTTLEATTVDATNVEVTNVKAKDGTAAIAIADSTGAVTVSTPTVVSVNSSSTALRITQTGSGNALLVEDGANPDSTPFAVDSTGFVLAGYTANVDGSQIQTFNGSQTNFRWNAASTGPNSNFKKSRSTVVNSYSIVGNGDRLGTLRWFGDDGAAFVEAASVQAEVDGTPGTNDMPGRLVFSTTADGAATPTERMRIDNAGRIGFNSTSLGGGSGAYRFSGNITGSINSAGIFYTPTVSSDVTSNATLFAANASTQDNSFALTNLNYFSALQGTITGGTRTAPTSQFGFRAESSLTGATNNYGFYSNIASGTNRWNFFANGTAANYFAGTVSIGTTSTSDAGVVITPSVERDGNWDAKLALQSTANGDYPTLYFSGCNGTQRYGAIVQTTSTSGNASFNITSSIEFLNSSATAGNIVFKTNNTVGTGAAVERLRIGADGNVGIGTPSPTAPLTVLTSNATDDSTARVAVLGLSNTNMGQLEFRSGRDDTAFTNRYSSIQAWSNQLVAARDLILEPEGGNVGIGTTSPAVQVHATGVGRFSQLQLPNNAGTYTSGSAGFHLFGFSDNALYFNWFDNGAIVFRNNGTSERLRITAAGDIGIGTASPAAKLDIAASVPEARLSASGGATGQLLADGSSFYVGPTGAHALRLQTNGTTRVLVDSSGNVGINNAIPGSFNAAGLPLVVGSGAGNQGLTIYSGTAGYGGIHFADGTTSTDSYRGIVYYQHTNDSMQFWTSATERMRIDSLGRVGIGSSTPGTYSERLIVQSTAGSQASMMWVNPGQGSGQIGIAASGPNFKIYNTYTDGLLANGKGIDIDLNGNVGIGTASPGNSKLRVQNASGVFGNSNPIQSWTYANFQVTNLHIDGSVNPVFNTDAESNWNPPATMIWQFRGTERMRLTAGGDFYVGTSSDLGAAAQMQVVGSDADRIAMRCTGASAGQYWRLSVDTGNTMYVQNQSAAGVYITNGGTSWTALSDERFKTDLKPIEDSVNKVCQLRAVTGRYKTDEEGVSRSFLIAQDVLAVLPEAVDARNPEKLGVAYTDVIPLLVAAIKELSAKVAALEAK